MEVVMYRTIQKVALTLWPLFVSGACTNEDRYVDSSFLGGPPPAIHGEVQGSLSETKVASVGGVDSSRLVSAVQAVEKATPQNAADSLVKRDALGNFVAGTITANLSGTASFATNLSGNLSGDITSIGMATTLSNNAVTAAKIAPGIISNVHLSDNAAISVSKLAGGSAGQVLQINNGSPSWQTLTIPAGRNAGGRLTLVSGQPIGEATGGGSIFYTPYEHDQIALFDGAQWKSTTFSELSLSLSGLPANKNYDVFAYSNNGTPTLTLGTAWVDDSTRTDLLSVQNGVLVKSTSSIYRYVGTVRTSGVGISEDNERRRFVWNYDNRIRRKLKVVEATETWSYSTPDVWRSANNSDANRVEVVTGGLAGFRTANVQLEVRAYVNTGQAFGLVGIGINTTSQNNADLTTGMWSHIQGPVNASLINTPPPGYRYYQWVEKLALVAASPVTFHGGASVQMKAGLLGYVE